MSYLDHPQDPARRAKAIVAVGAIHAMIGYVLVTGLGAEIVERFAPPPLVGTNIPLPPPPDPKPAPESAEKPLPPTALLPPIELPRSDPPPDVLTEDKPLPPLVSRVPEGPTLARLEPSRPRPAFTPRKAKPINGPLGWISTDDYPARALRSEAEGVAAYRLIVGTDGRVSACDVTRSTGNGLLDDATCEFIARRARFEAATDDTGAKVVGNYTGTVKWEIPD